MKVSDFDYELPNELIARYPPTIRGDSRLLVLHRDSQRMEDRMFSDLRGYLNSGDTLVLNSTRVIPARLIGERKATGAKIELFLLRELSRESARKAIWEVLAKPAKKVRVGDSIEFSDVLVAAVIEEKSDGIRHVAFNTSGEHFESVLERIGHVPLPPYIDRDDEPIDRERYQTVFATVSGGVAAPTAGLHFTEDLLASMRQDGVEMTTILLHTGLGTFRPVEVDEVEAHRMHEEYYEISTESAERINRCKRSGGRVVAIGTTTVRTLETNADADGSLHAARGFSDIFIYPPYRFRVPNAMLTNFHMPRSTLVMMVSAFAGRDFLLAAYEHAVRERYRFFSYGDAMLIL